MTIPATPIPQSPERARVEVDIDGGPAKIRPLAAGTWTVRAGKHVAKGTAKVSGAQFGPAGTGKVKVHHPQEGDAHGRVEVQLAQQKGIASISLKNVKQHGKWSITAKFGGDKALKPSSKKDTFKV